MALPTRDTFPTPRRCSAMSEFPNSLPCQIPQILSLLNPSRFSPSAERCHATSGLFPFSAQQRLHSAAMDPQIAKSNPAETSGFVEEPLPKARPRRNRGKMKGGNLMVKLGLRFLLRVPELRFEQQNLRNPEMKNATENPKKRRKNKIPSFSWNS